jgi:nitrous oxidase accessory protein
VIWRNISKNNIRYGLHFMFSNDDMYVNNVFRNNGSGVSVMYSNRIKMFSNYFEENWGDAAHGILLKEISDGYMEGNYFTKNTSAIFMEGANRIHMKRNVFENNGWALKIQASCADVILEYNNFIGNTFDVGTNGSLVLNQFKNNYWDKYEGYDLNKDKIGDIPYRPVSMYSMIVEKYPPAMILFRSFITTLLDKTEKILPSLTPENLKDNSPMMNKAF